MHSSTERHGCWATTSSPEVSRWQRATIFWGRSATRMPGSRRSTACAAGRGGPAEGRQAGGRAAGGQAGRQAGGRPDELEDVNYGRAIQGLGQAGRGSRRQGGRREDGRREDERRGQTAVEEGQAASRELESCEFVELRRAHRAGRRQRTEQRTEHRGHGGVLRPKVDEGTGQHAAGELEELPAATQGWTVSNGVRDGCVRVRHFYVGMRLWEGTTRYGLQRPEPRSGEAGNGRRQTAPALRRVRTQRQAQSRGEERKRVRVAAI